MGWGLGFGIFWWFFGPLTLLRLASGMPLDWSAQQGSAVFGSLVGHILYGLILGIAYATIDKVWVRLFIQSDPLNREIEGPGLHILRSLGWGAMAGLIGGLVSMPVMIATGVPARSRGRRNYLCRVSCGIHSFVGQHGDRYDLWPAVSG